MARHGGRDWARGSDKHGVSVRSFHLYTHVIVYVLTSARLNIEG